MSRLLVRPFFAPLAFLTFVILAPALAAAATLSGLVTDPDGRAAPGARIIVSRHGTVHATALTNDSGRFTIDRLDGGPYEIRVALDGFVADVVAVDLGADEAQTVNLGLRVSAFSETVVVTAAQADLTRSDVADSVTIVTAEDLAAGQIETVAEALRLVPGLTVTMSGGRGGLTSLFPRGGESDFTLVLIDGIRANSFGGGYDFAHLPVADIERIEVVRGPQSAVFGSDAIGGVIHIITRHGGRPRAEMAVEGGSFGTTRVALTASGDTAPWSWGAAFQQLDTDGFTGLASGTGERVTNDDYQTRDGSASVAWHGDAGTEIRLTARIGTNERGFPGAFGSDPGRTYPGVDRVSRGENETRLFGAGVTHRWSPNVRQQVELSHGAFDGDFTSQFGRSFSESRRLSVRTQTDASVGARFDVSMGLEVQRERAGSTFITGSEFTPIPVRRWVSGYFGEARIKPTARVSITAGLRVEHIRRDALERNPSPFSPRPTFGRRSEISANPKLSAGIFLRRSGSAARNWTRLRVSAGTGIRPPGALEIAFTDNPDLRPERSRSVDAGLQQAVAGGAGLLEATAFSNRYDGLIVAVGRSLRDASRFQTDNIANSRARGVELAATARTSWGLDLRGTYTWLDTDVLSVDRLAGQAPPPFQVGDPLLRRPRHQAAIDAAVIKPRWSGWIRLVTRGQALDVDPTFGAFGGLYDREAYAVADAGARVRVWKTIDLVGRVENLTDRDYEETLGFPSLGRRATVGVRLATR